MQEAINKQTAESERRLDQRFTNFSSEMKQFTLNENEKAKRMITTMFEKQNQMFLNLTTQMQENLIQMHENVKDMAMQTNTSLIYTHTPWIDVHNTSPVAQRKAATESTGLRDAGT